MKSKIITKKYDLKTNKIKNPIKLILLSDVHISNIFKVTKISEIINKIKQEKPDYICLPGDLIDCSNVLNNQTLKEITLNFIKELANISPVIISLGNHDVCYLNKVKDKKKNQNKWHYDKNESFFKELNKIKNVHLLDDETYTDHNISFTGISLSYKYYKESNEDKNIFITDIKNKILKINKNKYNILLCHSPVNVLEDASFLKDMDLILSGHMHNGMVHPLIEKVWKGNKGIITPTKELYPKASLTRGIVKKDQRVLIISGGITKLSYSSPRLFNLLNDLYPMNIEIININN